MEKITVVVEQEPVRLDHLLQLAGIAISGGQAGQMIKDCLVTINNQPVTEKRKKIFSQDKIIFDKEYLLDLQVCKS